MARPILSLVLPVYNEEEVIPILHARLQDFLAQVGVDTEVIFVNDGSTDRSLILLRELVAHDNRYKAISFTRNFGHGNAITAGVDYARGHAIAIMDADLQDPPEVIVKMLERWRDGYDVVYGQRLKREGETPFKLLTSKWFYRILRALVPINVPLDTGDFRLMSRQVVVTLRALRETHRFIRGIVSWIGFRQTAVFYDRPSRAAGETKYPISKMLRLALDAITSFSVLPLRFSTYLGMFISFASVMTALWAAMEHFVFHNTVPGWTATVILISLLSSVQLLMIGIVGEYVGRIYEQVKGRPLYLVAETLNMPREVDTDELEPVDAVSLWMTPPSPGFPAPQEAPFPIEAQVTPPPASTQQQPPASQGPDGKPPTSGPVASSGPPPPLVRRSAPPPVPVRPPPPKADPAQPVMGLAPRTPGQPNRMKSTLMGISPAPEAPPSSHRPPNRMKATIMGVSPSAPPPPVAPKEESEKASDEPVSPSDRESSS
jgi:glycosyltransferase involved in cell wall biosynthesis